MRHIVFYLMLAFITLNTSTVYAEVQNNKSIKNNPHVIRLDERFNQLERYEKLLFENINSREKTVDWWLAALTILVAILGIAISISYLFQQKESKDAKKEVKNTEQEVKRIKEDMENLHEKAKKDTRKIETMKDTLQATDPEKIGKDPNIRSTANQVLISPQSSTVDKLMAEAYKAHDEKNMDAAIHKWQSVLDIARVENNTKIKLISNSYLGYAYTQNGQWEKAIEAFTQAINLDPKHLGIYNNRGNAYAKKGEYDKAIEDHNKAIELDPKYALAYYNRGNDYVNKGEYDKAIEDFNKAIELDPKYALAYSNRGHAYADKGEYDKAIEDFNKAIELDPKYALAYNNRGLVYADKRRI